MPLVAATAASDADIEELRSAVTELTAKVEALQLAMAALPAAVANQVAEELQTRLTG